MADPHIRAAARPDLPEPIQLTLGGPDMPVAPERAKLRIYIGAAPGVGKTFQMLETAHLMRKQGIDVVIGLIETHGRADTAAMVGDLEIIPQKEIPYRSVILPEMDLDAILKHHPNTVIVDELAHTNVPGSRNRKRYEDVLELLDAGINVMTAVNVQHLETLNDAVARSASTIIRETVPDSLLKRADEVVNVDIPVDELRDRLRQGKIYAPEKIEQSLANFFRKGNLNMLRELALRTTAGTSRHRSLRIPPHSRPRTGPHAREGDGLPLRSPRRRAPPPRRRPHRRTPRNQLVRGLRRAARPGQPP